MINTEKYMVKVSEEAFEQVGSVVDNLLKAEREGGIKFLSLKRRVGLERGVAYLIEGRNRGFTVQ